jgi:hypothetical protein
VPGTEAQAGEAARVKAHEREIRELRRANDFLREAGACFAAALDCPLKR